MVEEEVLQVVGWFVAKRAKTAQETHIYTQCVPEEGTLR